MVQKRSNGTDWDGLEAILLVGRHGTVRAAADAAKVAHTTLARRISAAERQLGIIAFVKSVKGYVPTAEGQVVIEHAEKMAFEASVMAQRFDPVDQPLAGQVSVSLSPTILTHLVAPNMAGLYTLHPSLSITFDTGDAIVDLDRRDADIVLRMQRAPAGDLVGRRIAEVHVAAYRHRGSKNTELSSAKPVPVIGWSSPSVVRKSFAKLGIPDVRIVASTADISAQIALGASYNAALELPCYIGDATPELERIAKESRALSDLWCLTHPSLRSSHRVQAVVGALSDVLADQRSLIEGKE